MQAITPRSFPNAQLVGDEQVADAPTNNSNKQPVSSSDTITSLPASSIIGGLQYSIGNLMGWASYIAKSAASKLFSSAPVHIRKDDFLALINNEKKTPKEKMAALNAIICLGADYPELQKDVVDLIGKVAEKLPLEFGQFCEFVGISKNYSESEKLSILLNKINRDTSSAFTKMKEAMVEFYCSPFQDDINKLNQNIHNISKLGNFCSLLQSKELKETLKVLDKQPIAKEFIQKIVNQSIPHIKELCAFMINVDKNLPENEHFGLHAIARESKSESAIAIFTKWVNSDSFNFKALKKTSRKFQIILIANEFASANNSLEKLKILHDCLFQVPSNRMGEIIVAFTDKSNNQEFDVLLQKMIECDDPVNPILPVGVKTNPEIINWLIKAEKFGTEEKDGKIIIKVNEFAPKVALLQKSIIECQFHENKKQAIQKAESLIFDLESKYPNAKTVTERLLLALQDKFLGDDVLIKIFNVVAKERRDLFSWIAESVIDKQIASINNNFADTAKKLQDNVNNNENSAVFSEKNRKENAAVVHSYIKENAGFVYSYINPVLPNIGDPVSTLYNLIGKDREMNATARYIEFRKYINSPAFDRNFIASGLEIHLKEWKK